MKKQVSKKEVLSPHRGLAHSEVIRNAALRDYLSGMSRKEVAQKYSLPDVTILSYWKRKFAPETLKRSTVKMSRPRKKRMLTTDAESHQSVRIAELEHALTLKNEELKKKDQELERAHLARDIAETMIDIAEESFDIVIRKNSGTR